MANETKIDAKVEAAVEAAAAPANAVVKVAEKAVEAKPAVKAVKRVTKRSASTAKAVRKTSKRVVAKAKKAKPAVARRVNKIEGTKTMTYDFNQLFAGFQLPGTDKYQDLFANAGERGQQFVAKSQQAAEELTSVAKANVDAFVEAGKIAASGAKKIGQDVIASGRDGIEQASDALKTLAEAKSPAEFFQIQSELARASFDRLVTQSSQLTERVVKLAGETAEPLQTRASLNAERINTLVA
ncbi:MAG TPA: phasin family protein [Sphingomicrobium sp.]|nr:phasin family protein [Sphingomicrobium sp.]